MKRFTPITFIFLLVVIGSCSDDDSLGNRLDHIRYYDFVYPGSGFYAEKKFHYDDQGRVSKTVSTNLLDHVYIADYTYEENLLTVHMYSAVEPDSDIRYRLKFEDDRLTRFVIAQQIGEMFRTDSVDFLYEAGKLNGIEFGESSYPVTVDDSGNVTHYAIEDNVRIAAFEYDNSPNPFKGMPSGFIFLSFNEGIPNRLWMRNIVEFMSPNNWKSENKTYTYQDGKVIELKETMHGTWTKAKFFYDNP